MRTALTIAGSDPSGGAGVQADLKTFAALGVYGVSAIAAITAQSTVGVTAIESLSADLVDAQMEAVAGDVTIDATKTGMLGTAAIVEAVAAAVDELSLPLLVVDPVIMSTSGTPLLDDEGVEVMRRELVPRAAVVTPNIQEAETLAGRSIRSLDDARAAAERIRNLGAQVVVITGGHGSYEESVDLAFDGHAFTELRTARIAGPHVHGTGCAHSAALAAGLALGFTPVESARLAQAYVAGAIRAAMKLGRGALVLNHFWQVPIASPRPPRHP